MSYKTDKVFGRRETVHIVSPNFLQLPKVEIEVPADVKVDAGLFVGVDGNLLTLTDTIASHFLVTESTYYDDFKNRNKPANVMEGYFGQFLVHTKVFEEGDTAFAKGDKVTIISGKFAHVDDTHTVAVGEVTDRGADWIAVAML